MPNFLHVDCLKHFIDLISLFTPLYGTRHSWVGQSQHRLGNRETKENFCVKELTHLLNAHNNRRMIETFLQYADGSLLTFALRVA